MACSFLFISSSIVNANTSTVASVNPKQKQQINRNATTGSSIKNDNKPNINNTSTVVKQNITKINKKTNDSNVVKHENMQKQSKNKEQTQQPKMRRGSSYTLNNTMNKITYVNNSSALANKSKMSYMNDMMYIHSLVVNGNIKFKHSQSIYEIELEVLTPVSASQLTSAQMSQLYSVINGALNETASKFDLPYYTYAKSPSGQYKMKQIQTACKKLFKNNIKFEGEFRKLYYRKMEAMNSGNNHFFIPHTPKLQIFISQPSANEIKQYEISYKNLNQCK